MAVIIRKRHIACIPPVALLVVQSAKDDFVYDKSDAIARKHCFLVWHHDVEQWVNVIWSGAFYQLQSIILSFTFSVS